MDIGKECKSKGFPAHLFVIVISLSKYGVIEVGLKYHSNGQKLKTDGEQFSIVFGNTLIFHADIFHSLYFQLCGTKCLGSQYQLDIQRNLPPYNPIYDLHSFKSNMAIMISYIYAFI